MERERFHRCHRCHRFHRFHRVPTWARIESSSIIHGVIFMCVFILSSVSGFSLLLSFLRCTLEGSMEIFALTHRAPTASSSSSSASSSSNLPARQVNCRVNCRVGEPPHVQVSYASAPGRRRQRRCLRREGSLGGGAPPRPRWESFAIQIPIE